jgi:hypothetical protein
MTLPPRGVTAHDHPHVPPLTATSIFKLPRAGKVLSGVESLGHHGAPPEGAEILGKTYPTHEHEYAPAVTVASYDVGSALVYLELVWPTQSG